MEVESALSFSTEAGSDLSYAMEAESDLSYEMEVELDLSCAMEVGSATCGHADHRDVEGRRPPTASPFDVRAAANGFGRGRRLPIGAGPESETAAIASAENRAMIRTLAESDRDPERKNGDGLFFLLLT